MKGRRVSYEKELNQAVTAGTQILWEPGCTYELPELRVVNKGNLALKYKIAITGIHGDAKLNEAIDWTLKLNNEGFNYDIDAEHSLAAGANHSFTIKGHMREDAGNEYQGLSIDNIAITVIATQDTVESDSINNNYDSSAAYCEWPVVVNQAVAKDSSGNITDQTLTKYVASDVQAQVNIPAAAVDSTDDCRIFDRNILALCVAVKSSMCSPASFVKECPLATIICSTIHCQIRNIFIIRPNNTVC